MMPKGKKPPERSKIERAKPLAYQRRALDDARVVSEDNKVEEATAPAAEVQTEERATGEMTAVEKPSEEDAPAMPEAKLAEEPAEAANVELVADVVTEPEPTVEPELVVEPEPPANPVRASRATIAMPVLAEIGGPPEVPGDVENPTEMPGPNDVPSGSPTDAARAPGHVPSGDSRSLRREGEFALIYRQGCAVITRFGAIGQRGQWRVVEYPTPSSASTAYAKECSRFVGDGFSDYRD